MLEGRGLVHLAGDRLAELLESHPDDRDVQLLHLSHTTKMGDFHSVGMICRSMLEKFSDDPAIRIQLIDGLIPSGLHAEALESIEWLLSKSNPNPNLLSAKSDVLERLGRNDEAWEAFEKFRANPMAQTRRVVHREANLLLAEKRYEDAKACLVGYLGGDEEDRITDQALALQVELYFMLAKAYDRSGDYDSAWAAAARGHELDGTPFRQDEYDETAETIKRVVTKELLPYLGRGTNESCEPLLILGNPRSGTTMLDQILSMHPEAAAGGELFVTAAMASKLSRVTDSYQAFPASLLDLREADADLLGSLYESVVSTIGPGKRYVSNKSLALQLHVPLVTRCLPKTRIINLHRHPLDNILSCYTMNLVANHHYYTNRIENLARTWVTRRKLQDYWQQTIDVPIMELHYESMVSDQAGETRRLLEFLDLPWNDSCMEFHRSTNVARTISRDQVSQPMYTTSKGRWRNYEKHLEPVFGILEDYL